MSNNALPFFNSEVCNAVAPVVACLLTDLVQLISNSYKSPTVLLICTFGKEKYRLGVDRKAARLEIVKSS